MRLVFAILALIATPVLSATLPITPDMITYEGFFRLDSIGRFNSGAKDISLALDCMGEDDPTPDDSYPGCIMYADNYTDGELWVVLSDIVPPTMTGTGEAVLVGSQWDAIGDLYETVGCSSPDRANPPFVGCPGTGAELHIYYDDDPGGCKLIWAAISEYSNSPYDDDYIFGTSSCSFSTPNPQGMYLFDSAAQSDPSPPDAYSVTKWVYNITRIPSAIATDYFGGDEMLLGPGKSTGSRASSAGPSFGVRPWTFPTDSGGWDEFTPIFYYNSPAGYPDWEVPTDFQSPHPTPACTAVGEPHTCCLGVGTGCTGRDWSKADDVLGVETIRITYGGDDYEAALFFGSAAVVDPNLYPANSLTSSPTESASDPNPGARDGSWGTYGDWDGTLYPDLSEVPHTWYGIEEYNTTGANFQQPSYGDTDVNGDWIPYDSNIVSHCSHGTGPSGQAMRSFIWLYDLAELGDMYAGTSGYGPEELQAYAEMDVSFDPNNDGVLDINETCVQPNRQHGIAYDHTNNLLYVTVDTDPSTASQPYSPGPNRGVMVFSIDPSGAAAPDPDVSIAVDGASATGANVN